MTTRSRLFGLASGMIFLSGCINQNNRYLYWAHQQFTQVAAPGTGACCGADFVRRADVYDGFNTVGHYDVLWYASPVRATHIEQLAQRAGWTPEAIDQQLRDEYHEDRTTLTFYVLASGGNTESMRPRIAKKPQEQALGMWSLVMRIDGDEYAPCSIKKTMLPTDLIYCFGDRYDFHFRDTYCVTFARRVGKRDLLNTSSDIALVLRNVHYCVALCWDAALVAQTYHSTLLNPCAATTACAPDEIDQSPTRSPMGVQEIRI